MSPTNLEITEEVRQAVLRHIAALSEKCQNVLFVAAVVGGEFTVDVLEAVCDRPAEQVRRVLEEEVAAGVLKEVSGELGRYAFNDPAFREALYEDLPPARRSWVHRRIGEALERIHAGDLEARLSELSYHFAKAAEAGAARRQSNTRPTLQPFAKAAKRDDPLPANRDFNLCALCERRSGAGGKLA